MAGAVELTELPFVEVLGLDLSADARQRVIAIGRRIGRLTGHTTWTVADLPVPVANHSRYLAGTGMPLPSEPDDGLELALGFWRAADGGLLVTATVDVDCRCPADHNMHPAAEAEWTVRDEQELVDALERAAELLHTWAADDASPAEWRQRANLPNP